MAGTVAKKQIDVTHADLSNAGGMLEMAGTVAGFITEQKLSQNIQGKNYVNVEGWQFAGGMIGVLPIVQHTENLSKGDELKYRAVVDLINIKNGQKVGAGIATCSNKESGKKFFAEYAIESMAQTRAVGKAYRLMLGWLMKAAGYEATPAEEMDFNTEPKVEKAKEAAPSVTTADKVAPNPMTPDQEQELRTLIQHDLINPEEETKVLEALSGLNFVTAARWIAQLMGKIKEREEQAAAAA